MYDEKIQLFIDGVWRASGDGRTQDLVNPATEEVLGTVPLATEADLTEALAASQKGFAVWKAMTAAARGAILMAAADLIERDKARIGRILTLENGKPIAEAVAEVQFAADATRWYAEEGKRVYGRLVPARVAGMRQMVTKEPVGPVVAFAAWNFPASNVIRKIAGALGAGCSIVMKPAEETPGTAIAMVRCFEKAGLPAGALNLVFGVPDDVSRTLLASPVAKKLSLTGSTVVGKLLQKRAADTLKRTTMELGGHAPVIVHADADVDRAIAALVTAKFRNAGQVCTSPTRFFVHEDVLDSFTAGFVEKAAALRLGNGLEDDVQMGPMIAPRRLDFMDELIADAVSKGARIATGGSRRNGPGYFFAPTVLTDVSEDARILHEEPFGPIAPIMSFSDLGDVFARANSLPYGLASFCFTRSGGLAAQTEAALDAGLVGVNHTMISTPETPFGGVNESGFGSESGSEGLDAFLRTKFISEIFP